MVTQLDSIMHTPRPFIMGVDPGLNGAICVVNYTTNAIVDIIDLPKFKTPTKARVQGFFEHIDTNQMAFLVSKYAEKTSAAFIEEPGAMPKQGLSSTFRFGKTCGQIHGVLAGLFIPVLPVSPGAWKSALNLSTNKDDSRALATRIFPKWAHLWSLKRYNDRAEAALITVFAKRYLSEFIRMNAGL